MRGDRGATAVETALVLPLVLGLVGMILTVSVAVSYQALLERGAEQAARILAVQYIPDGCLYRDEQGRESGTEKCPDLFAVEDVVVEWQDEGRREGSRFTVTVIGGWDNPATALVHLLTGGGVDREWTFTATATGVKE